MGNDFILIDGSDGQENRGQQDGMQENRMQGDRTQMRQPYGYYQTGQENGSAYQKQYRQPNPQDPSFNMFIMITRTASSSFAAWALSI